jgi:pimeloyl-ACP methyl ester carboxylesterase
MTDMPITRAGSVCLADGRRLTFAETGPPEGRPVVYCHGAIGTALRDGVDLDAITHRLSVRHIAVNRPGFGGSDLAPGRGVLGFAGDLEELADTLALERFALIAVSAGGPYALAAARRLGDRVLRVAVCSSLSPLCPPHRTPGMARRIRLALSVLAAAPGPCRASGDALLPLLRRRPGLLHRVIAAHAAPAERRRLTEPAERRAAAASFLDATSYGVAGMIEDYLTYSRAWGFGPGEIDTEVHVWHGGIDPLVPVEHALQLAVALRRCRIFVDPDEGHHFFRRRLDEILTMLLGGPGGDEASPAGVAASRRLRSQP